MFKTSQFLVNIFLSLAIGNIAEASWFNCLTNLVSRVKSTARAELDPVKGRGFTTIDLSSQIADSSTDRILELLKKNFPVFNAAVSIPWRGKEAQYGTHITLGGQPHGDLAEMQTLVVDLTSRVEALFHSIVPKSERGHLHLAKVEYCWAERAIQCSEKVPLTNNLAEPPFYRGTLTLFGHGTLIPGELNTSKTLWEKEKEVPRKHLLLLTDQAREDFYKKRLRDKGPRVSSYSVPPSGRRLVFIFTFMANRSFTIQP